MGLRSKTGMLVVVAALALVDCGSEESWVYRHAAWAGSQATGTLMAGDVALCTATLVAPDVLVTSGRCARAALHWHGSTFQWAQGMRHFTTAVRDGYVADEDGNLAPPRSRFRPPARTAERRGAVRTLQRLCHVDDIFALTRSQAVHNCLDAAPTWLLRAAGDLGLAAWDDIGWLGLAEAVPTTAARLATAEEAGALAEDAVLQRIGVHRGRNRHASLLQRYEHDYRLYEADATEMHAGPLRGPTHGDVGGALWMEVHAAGGSEMALVGVAGRPFVAHGDPSAGMIFARLDAHLEMMSAAVQRLTRVPRF